MATSAPTDADAAGAALDGIAAALLGHAAEGERLRRRRAVHIRNARAAGWTLDAIGQRLGLPRQRVYALLRDDAPAGGDDDDGTNPQ